MASRILPSLNSWRAWVSWASTAAALAWAALSPGVEPVMFCPAVRSPEEDATAHPASAARPRISAAATGMRHDRLEPDTGPAAAAAGAALEAVAVVGDSM